MHPQEIQRHLPLALPFRVRDEWGVIVAGAQPVGQCQLMGERRPAYWLPRWESNPGRSVYRLRAPHVPVACIRLPACLGASPLGLSGTRRGWLPPSERLARMQMLLGGDFDGSERKKARVANQRASKIQGELCHQHLPQSLQAMARLWLRASGRTSRRERISILCGPQPQSYTASGWVQAFLDRLARAVHTVIHEVSQPAPSLPVRNP